MASFSERQPAAEPDNDVETRRVFRHLAEMHFGAIGPNYRQAAGLDETLERLAQHHQPSPSRRRACLCEQRSLGTDSPPPRFGAVGVISRNGSYSGDPIPLGNYRRQAGSRQ